MDQTCPVVHKSRRPQARLKTVTLFYIHCDLTQHYGSSAWQSLIINRADESYNLFV
jgi:hypothetical protein